MKKEYEEVLNFEIKWCEENSEEIDCSDEYKQGFIAGLKQAIYLLDKVDNLI